MTVVILAGGQSRRMGRDKLRLTLEGETLLLRSDRGKQFPHLIAALDQLNERGVHYETAIAERARELAPRILSFGGVAILPEYLKSEVPGIAGRPYDDGIAIRRCAIMNGITMFTSLDTVRILLDVLEDITPRIGVI